MKPSHTNNRLTKISSSRAQLFSSLASPIRISSRFSFSFFGIGSNVLRFYTDNAPSLKISPNVVLVMSLCFFGFTITLHVFGKLYRYRSGAPRA
ncbi:Protein transport protein Sec61 subunit beta [Camellia lanceoleosa]|uniref:Protein transport protein Sec61 subunit beta n=1 Tax=Camellia lanceoleosa TaxID=1840588 RepID=A0ACC0GM52_9ERIC|nr:Protein transport protein Sec61 subunit beta [Camellia lanceoleosa]